MWFARAMLQMFWRTLGSDAPPMHDGHWPAVLRGTRSSVTPVSARITVAPGAASHPHAFQLRVVDHLSRSAQAEECSSACTRGAGGEPYHHLG